MRRSALVFLLTTAALAAGCSPDESNPAPTGPSSQPDGTPEANLNLRCREHGLISIQLARILPAGPPLRLLAKGLTKFALVEAALLTNRKPLAQARALDLIDFLVDNRPNLINPTSATTATRLGNVTDAILCLVGLSPTGATVTPNTVIVVVPANNVEAVTATTLDGNEGFFMPAGSVPDKDVNGNSIAGVVITLTDHEVGDLDTPLDKYGEAIDLDASEDVIWLNKVTVAACVEAEDDPDLFARLRVGHEGGEPGNRFGAIEILPPAVGGVIEGILDGCPEPSLSLTGQSGFAGLKELAQRVLLPDPLYAAVVPKTVGVGGLTSNFNKFQVVDPQLDVEVNPPVSTGGVAGQEVDDPPSVLVRTDRDLTAVPGIRIKFNVTGGTGSSIVPADPAFVETDATGVATATSWTIVAGVNTATATPVSPVPVAANQITFTPTTITFTATGTNSPAGVISNGTITLGVNQAGNLIVNNVGLSFGGAEALDWGTLTEGWGVARTGSLVTGYANVAQGAPVGLTIESFSKTATEAKSTVRIGSTYRVTHEFTPPPSPLTNLYAVSVTIENLSGAPLNDVVYRRVMDWDIPPQVFTEFVSVRGTGSTPGVSASNNGPDASANPLDPRGGSASGNFSSGPGDFGAVFDLSFNLATGANKTFVLYYGAASNTEAAKAVAVLAEAEVLSLARPGVGPLDGSPTTFIAAFKGLGGTVLSTSLMGGMLRLSPSSQTTRPSLQTQQQLQQQSR